MRACWRQGEARPHVDGGWGLATALSKGLADRWLTGTAAARHASDRAASRAVFAPEIGAFVVLALFDHLPADGAGAGEEVEQGIPVA